MATQAATRPTRSSAQASGRNWLDEVSRVAQQRPSAAIVYGVPGVGKTSLAAQIPGVVFLIDDKEDGINRLKEAGLAPTDIPVLPAAKVWQDVMEMLEALRTGGHQYKALAVDAIGGLERLCHEEVCRRDFHGDWGEHGFTGYMRGYDISLADWRMFLNAIDALRDQRSMSIMLLGHARVSPFKNPEGPDYDRYNVDTHHKTWALTHKWADMVLFANYEVVFKRTEESKPKAKAHGGKTRILRTEYHPAFDAKNRCNLPAEIDMGTSGKEAWTNLVQAIKAGRSNGNVVNNG